MLNERIIQKHQSPIERTSEVPSPDLELPLLHQDNVLDHNIGSREDMQADESNAYERPVTEHVLPDIPAGSESDREEDSDPDESSVKGEHIHVNPAPLITNPVEDNSRPPLSPYEPGNRQMQPGLAIPSPVFDSGSRNDPQSDVPPIVLRRSSRKRRERVHFDGNEIDIDARLEHDLQRAKDASASVNHQPSVEMREEENSDNTLTLNTALSLTLPCNSHSISGTTLKKLAKADTRISHATSEMLHAKENKTLQSKKLNNLIYSSSDILSKQKAANPVKLSSHSQLPSPHAQNPPKDFSTPHLRTPPRSLILAVDHQQTSLYSMSKSPWHSYLPQPEKSKPSCPISWRNILPTYKQAEHSGQDHQKTHRQTDRPRSEGLLSNHQTIGGTNSIRRQTTSSHPYRPLQYLVNTATQTPSHQTITKKQPVAQTADTGYMP